MFTAEHLTVGAWRVVCYTLTNEEGTLTIDPSVEPRALVRWSGDKKVIGIVLTHCHSDHIGATNKFIEAYGCPVAYGVDGVDGIVDIHHPGFDEEGIDCTADHVDRFFAEDDVTTWGGDTLRIPHTPGYTPGSICLLGTEQQVLSSGDTLLSGAIDSTVFVLGDYAELVRSCARLSQMDSSLTVCPGHGSTTTLRAEKPMLSYLAQSALRAADHSSSWREGSWW